MMPSVFPRPSFARFSRAGHVLLGSCVAVSLCGLHAGCHAPGSTDSSQISDSDDSQDPQKQTCVEDESAFQSITDETTLVPMVHRVRWDLAEKGSAFVRFTEAGGPSRDTPPVAAGEPGEMLILGVAPLSDVTWQIWLPEGDTWRCSAPRSYTTGGLDPSIPDFRDSDFQDPSERGGLAVVPILTEDDCFLSVVDDGGRIVWSTKLPERAFRGRLAYGGDAILYGGMAAPHTHEANVTRLSLDGTVISTVTLLNGHTDVAELPDGTIAMLGWDLRSYEDDTRRIMGDTIIERSPNGDQRTVWSLFDDYEPDLSIVYDKGFYEDDPTIEDWSHANGLSYDPINDAYFISIANLSVIAKIDRASGEMLWSIGNTTPTFSTPGGLIENPHSVQGLPDGTVLVFNRHFEACSSVDVISVDDASRTTKRIRSYTTPDCLSVYFLGDAKVMPDGNLLISWSSSGRLEEVDPNMNTVRQFDLGLGAVFGFVDPIVSLYDKP
jgi:hypothetical protein